MPLSLTDRASLAKLRLLLPPCVPPKCARVAVAVISLLILTCFYQLHAPIVKSMTRPTFSHLRDLSGQSAGERYLRSRPNAPHWCTVIASRPRALTDHDTDCNMVNRLLDDVNDRCARFFSQYNQDIWIWLAIAQFMTTPGVYVDVGANTPAVISNSYFFDRCLGWKGICVEAQDKYHPALLEHRTCSLASCVSDKEDDVMFVHADDLGGIASENKNVNGTKAWQHKANTAKQSKVHCRPLKDILGEERVSEVTYMSLDVEGAELLVLNGIDWGKVHVAFISMEGSAEKPAGKFLLEKGYTLLRSSGDGFFVSRKAMEMVSELKGDGYLENIIIPTD